MYQSEFNDQLNDQNSIRVESDGLAAAELTALQFSKQLACVKSLVRGIQEEPYQPVYRKKRFGAPVCGWDARLEAYFWPRPLFDYSHTCLAMQTIMAKAGALAESLVDKGEWSEAEGIMAVELANAIFTWGDVPQKPATVTPSSVKSVFQAALANNAKARSYMNSGWTKVAAFATAHLEQDLQRHPQAIWDSRVATAIISRLDAQLEGEDVPVTLFPGVGTVPGRGGTRPRKLAKRWPSGYRTWSGQIAGSALVRQIRDILNRDNGYPKMPLPEGGVGPWTTRGVEMVLFMDGY